MGTIGFICPLGESESVTRIRSDDIMENIIMFIAGELGYRVQNFGGDQTSFQFV